MSIKLQSLKPHALNPVIIGDHLLSHLTLFKILFASLKRKERESFENKEKRKEDLKSFRKKVFGGICFYT